MSPFSFYVRLKIACEDTLHMISDDYYNHTILRFSIIFGFSGKTIFDLAFNLLTAKAVCDNKITLFGGD